MALMYLNALKLNLTKFGMGSMLAASVYAALSLGVIASQYWKASWREMSKSPPRRPSAGSHVSCRSYCCVKSCIGTLL